MDMSRYKVLYQNTTYRCVALTQCQIPDVTPDSTGAFPAKGIIELLVLNEDGELTYLHDEAWCFRFFKL